MSTLFWIKRSLAVYCSVFGCLLVVELIKQHTIRAALAFACWWALMATSVFVISGLYYARRGIACRMCPPPGADSAAG